MTKIKLWKGKNYSPKSNFEISVLIPCWHCEKTISGALNSIENQRELPELFNIEVILIIDGRKEDYIAVKNWLNQKNNSQRWDYKIIKLDKNNGAGKAREIGYKICEGNFIAFLDDDDIWHPKKLYFQWQWHLKNPKYTISIHGYEFLPKEKNIKFINLLIGGDKIATPTIMIKRESWPFSPEPFRYGEDWLMLAMASTMHPIKLLPLNFASRSKKAPLLILDKYSLSRNRINLRLGKIFAICRLIYRNKLNIIWLFPLLILNLLLFIRRFIFDVMLFLQYFIERLKTIIKEY